MKARFTRRAETRRQEARRVLSEQRGTLWQQISKRISPASLAIWMGFYVTTLVIMLAGGESMPWRKNELADHDITARVAFEIIDAVATQDQRQVASASAPDVYVQNPAPLASIQGKLTELLAIAKASAGDAAKFREQAAAKGWTISEAAFETLKPYAANETRSSAYESLVLRLIADLGTASIVQKPDAPIREETPRTSILRTKDREETRDIEVLTSQLQYVTDAKAVRQIVHDIVARTFPESLQAPVAKLATQTLLGSGGKELPLPGKEPVSPGKETPAVAPLWRYDPAATIESIKQAQDRIKPIIVQKKVGDLLVRANTVLSNPELDLLKKEHEEYLRAENTDPALVRRKLLSELGMAIIVLMVTVGMAMYTAISQDRIFQKPGRTLGLAALLAMMVLFSRLLEQVQYPSHPPAEFSVGFAVITAMLLTIAYNQRFAFGASGALATLETLACRADFGLFLTLMVGMAVAVFTLREIRTRSKIVAVGAMAGIGALIADLAAGLIAGQELKYVFAQSAAAGGSALFAGFIVQGILPNFERLFGIATSMTLLEWSDASRPLLRRLAQEAPGTYSHSLMISQMAEEAAEAIRANGLLARVGAFYHDIGKTQKPEYFVENQEARMNRHDRLSPTMSLLIITGHVKDGLEMAKAYGLPRVLHQFIAEHHGTTIVKYFHHAASEAAARNTGRHGREVSESEFRYPGPKPRSRESAILMLCDGCEGAVRALAEPTPGRIESTVHHVIMDRLTDGQFEACEITIRELDAVEQSIVKSLCAIHHGRIKYPKEPKSAPNGLRSETVHQESRPRESSEENGRRTPDQVPTRSPEVARQA